MRKREYQIRGEGDIEADELRLQVEELKIDKEYAVERAAALATGVGIARLKLSDGDAAGAKKALDQAVAKCPDTQEFVRRYRAVRGGVQ